MTDTETRPAPGDRVTVARYRDGRMLAAVTGRVERTGGAGFTLRLRDKTKEAFAWAPPSGLTQTITKEVAG